MQLGLIGWEVAVGLGQYNRDLARHLGVQKWLVPEHPWQPAPENPPFTFCRRVSLSPDEKTLREFLDGLDWVLFVETPYVEGLTEIAAQMGVRVAAIPMAENFNARFDWVSHVDLMIPPTRKCVRLLKAAKREFGFSWRVVRIPGSVDTERFAFRPRDHCECFLFCNGHGGYAGRKGVGCLANAARLVPEIPIVLYSQTNNLPSLPSNVDVRPGTDIPEALYHECEVCIQPSRWEGLGLHLLEAQACGLPLITSNGPPMTEYRPYRAIDVTRRKLDIGGKAVTVYDAHPEHLARILREVWQSDVTAASTNARQFVLTQHSWHVNAPRLTALLESFQGPVGKNPTTLQKNRTRRAVTLSSIAETGLPGTAESKTRESSGNIGCVLAIRNRPPEMLERALQTYAYQGIRSDDTILLDYGSQTPFAVAYQHLCRRFGWRYVQHVPDSERWSLSAAYNMAVSRLQKQVNVVFKSDIDVLLGQGVLEMAAAHGRTKLCIFSCVTTEQDTVYPPQFFGHQDLVDQLCCTRPPERMLGEGIHAFPREWFERIGGYDLRFEGWGFEDSDLRARAERSIGVLNVTNILLVHQWHPRSVNDEQAIRNRAYYDEMKSTGPVVRNEGRLLKDRARCDAREAAMETSSVGETAPLVLSGKVLQPAHRILAVGADGGENNFWELLGSAGLSVKGVQDSETFKSSIEYLHLDAGEILERDFPPGPFDYIVCDRVLAHLAKPNHLLREACQRLAPSGHLLARVPNARHHGHVANVLSGGQVGKPQSESGPHPIRFFTRREIEKLFFRCGFEISEIHPRPSGELEEWRSQGRPGSVKLGPLSVGGLTSEQAEEFYTAEYVVGARPTVVPSYGLTSIVIVTHNQLMFTQQCVMSISQFTDEAYELIFVDNASTDGTVEYLSGLHGVKTVFKPENRGFPAAANEGIREAEGRQILLLNNDCVTTTGWLKRLLRALHKDPRVGLVGPCSNHVSGVQQIAVSYDDDLVGLDGFAWDWGKSNDRHLEETDRLVGFCLLIRREVIDQVGLLDERFGVGCFEDDDYCVRALRAGYRAVIARDAFVHHYGGRTFIASGVDFRALMAKNEQIFQAKWEAPAERRDLLPRQQSLSENPSESSLTPTRTEPAQGYSSTTGASPDHLGASAPVPRVGYGIRISVGGLLLEPKEIQLSLCMIARDNSKIIRAALKSAKPWVDEMIVVDTGSRDITPRIAERLGARMFQFAWCDDFSAARNESIRHARGQWIFWMDTDDTIDEINGRGLRDLVRQPVPSTLLGYVMKVRCPNADVEGSGDFTEVDHLKVFRNLPHLRFEGRIHEQIIPAINRAGGTWAWTELFVLHSGSDHSQEGQARKLERDLRILHHELADQPEHPFVLFNVGMTYRDARKYVTAAEFLRKSIHHSTSRESHLRKAYALLVDCCQANDNVEEAWNTCNRGLHLFPEDAELRFLHAGLLHGRGRLEEAAADYESLFRAAPDRYFSSRNQGITGFLARHNLAIVYTDLGRFPDAEREWRQIIKDKPRYRPGWRGLGENLLHQQKEADAWRLAERLAADSWLRSIGTVLRCRIAIAHGDVASARCELEEAVRNAPNETEPLDVLCQLLFEYGDLEDAERALHEKIRRNPADAAAYHNLGTIHMRQGRHADAVGAYRQSVRHRPDSPGTYFQLGNALRAIDRVEEAIAAWNEVIRIVPDDPEATEALRCATKVLP